jgi:hypothetical protein
MRCIGEVSPGIVGAVVAVVVMVVVAIGGTVVVGTNGTVLAAFATLGLLVQILVVRHLVKLGPGAGFLVVQGQVVLVDGCSPLVNHHSNCLFQVSQDVAGCDIGLADDVPDERQHHGDDNHVMEYLVNVNKN